MKKAMIQSRIVWSVLPLQTRRGGGGWRGNFCRAGGGTADKKGMSDDPTLADEAADLTADDAPEGDMIDWAAPVAALARPPKATASRWPAVGLAGLGAVAGVWFWTMRPRPAEAVAAPAPVATAAAERSAQVDTGAGEQRVELFELPVWVDDAK